MTEGGVRDKLDQGSCHLIIVVKLITFTPHTNHPSLLRVVYDAAVDMKIWFIWDKEKKHIVWHVHALLYEQGIFSNCNLKLKMYTFVTL